MLDIHWDFDVVDLIFGLLAVVPFPKIQLGKFVNNINVTLTQNEFEN